MLNLSIFKGYKELIAIISLLGIIACSQESEFTSRSISKNSDRLTADGLGQLSDADSIAGDHDGDGVADVAGGSAKIDGLSSVKHCDFAVDRGYLKTATETITYEGNFEMPGQCKWDELINGQIRGFKEWPRKFEISSDRVVCNMDLESAGDLRYDDTIILSLNDNMLMWGNLDIEVFEKVDGLSKYKLADIIGSSMNNRPVGCVDGSIDCDVPEHDSEGKLKLSFSEDLNRKIMLDVEDKGATFTLRAFGDNDDHRDCSHTGVELNITYTYFEK